MKYAFFLITFLLISCNDTSPKSSEKSAAKNIKSDTIVPKEQRPMALTRWLTHYQSNNPTFNEEKFTSTEVSPIAYSESKTIILNEEEFNEIYKPFLIFNKNGNFYLDIDSYKWEVANDGNISFEADQEVSLVDYRMKTARRIAFFGPSYTVEEAYWKGDSVAVLLGNSYEKVPFMLKFNFKNNTQEYFSTKDTLQFETSYYETRLKKMGLKLN